MKFLVTGGAGFIGSHIVESLQKLKHEVLVYDNFSTGKRENLAFVNQSNVQIIEADIRDSNTLNVHMAGVDGVFHQAALVSVPRSIEEPKLSFDINVNGTMNVFEAARKHSVKRIVLASSAAIYGNNSSLPLSESTQAIPLSPYGLDKFHTEKIAGLYQSLYGIESVALRYFNVYGPRQDPLSPYSGVISIFVDYLTQGRAPTIYGDGLQSRDFIYVKDIIQANLLAMFGAYHGFKAYNVGTGSAYSLIYLFDCLKSLLGRTLEPQYAPFRNGDINASQADISLIQGELDYQPIWTLHEGLKDMLDNYLASIT